MIHTVPPKPSLHRHIASRAVTDHDHDPKNCREKRRALIRVSKPEKDGENKNYSLRVDGSATAQGARECAHKHVRVVGKLPAHFANPELADPLQSSGGLVAACSTFPLKKVNDTLIAPSEPP